MRHRTNRTRWQQFQQRIIDRLCDVEITDVLLVVTLILLGILMAVSVHLHLTNGGCEEGYVYMRGVCVQGYRP